ncbi:MAG: hypothetical protein WC728_17800 [Elusimicrobiota bacterium]
MDTFFFRVRGFKGKELAFIVAGFAMLALAPIAEFLLTSPDEKVGGLRQGFDQKGVDYGGPGSPFEDGIARIAPGNLLGQIAESISPLTARDPVSLILSPQTDEGQPEAEEASPPRRAPPPKRESGWKDAISAAKKGTREAAKRVRLPVPSARLAGKLSGISGLSGGSGGSASAMSLSAPVSKGLLSRVATQDHLSRVQATSDYRGGPGRRSGAAGTGHLPGAYLDAKKVISGGGAISGTGGGNAPSGSGSISGGGSGSGSGGMNRSGNDPSSSGKSGTSVSSTADARNIQPKEKKESLAQMAKKMNMEQAIKLKWDKKRYDQIERKKMKEQIMMQTASQAFLKVLDKFLEAIFDAQGGAEGQKKKKKKSAEQAQQQDPMGGQGG